MSRPTGARGRRRPSPWHPPPAYLSPLTTPRMVIRPLAVPDAPAYAALVEAGRDDLRRWTDWADEAHRSTAETLARIEELSAARQHDPAATVLLALVDRGDGALVGALSLQAVDTTTASAEMGFWVAAPHRRRGLAEEAVRHLISAALGPATAQGWGFTRIAMTTTGSNLAARGLAHRLGLTREVRRRQDVVVAGAVDDTYGYAVLADEWDAEAMQMRRARPTTDVGVGPHPLPWPEDPRYDALLLRDGDRRNVADRYRWWRHHAIVADLAATAHPFHVAIENWHHDSNIGTVVRNANAFGAAGVHVVGRRSWNRRGAMVTDRYLPVHHHPDATALAAWARAEDLPLIGVDNLPGAVSLFDHPPPRRCVLLLGQEGPGLSEGARAAVERILHIPQFGSTRSINAGVASGIAMAAWVQVHAASG